MNHGNFPERTAAVRNRIRLSGGWLLLLLWGAGGVVSAADPVVPKAKVPLFNGKDMEGLHPFLGQADADPARTWSVSNGVLRCTGNPNGYIRTKVDYTQYKLHVEWRWAGAPGNSGVLLHVSEPDTIWPKAIESQLMHGNAGDFYVIRGTEFKEHRGVQGNRVPKKKASNENKAGEWNRCDIVCKDDTITVYVNGVLQNEATETSVRSGKIGLQSEGAPIDFRSIYIEPLD